MRDGDDPWLAANRWSLHLVEPDATFDWTFELSPNNDLRLVIGVHTADRDQRGEILIVAGKAMAIRGLDDLPAGRELEEVDGPGLTLQLTRELLRRAVPQGPAAVVAAQRAEVEEPTEPLAVGTLSASAHLPAPWHLTAELRPAGPATAFELSLRHGIGSAEEGALRVSGTCAVADPPPALDDAMPLDGWRVLRIGPRYDAQALDFGTRPVGPHSDRLGGLRR
jgi:hypothetical protein